VATKEDIRTGTDVETLSNYNLPYWLRRGKHLRNEALAAEWRALREVSCKYRFGRVELLPIKKTKEAFARYLGKYLTKTFNQIWGYTPNGTLVNNISSANDYIRDTLNYAETGTDRRNLDTTRVDYNITEKHQLSITYSYNMYQTSPDILNSVVPMYPGTGTIVRLNQGSKRDTIATGLFLPTAMTFGPDGDLYVSNKGFGPPIPGFGEILRIALNARRDDFVMRDDD